MHVHWQHKKKRSRMSNPAIDEYYELGDANGALGGKLIGAGGGGFLMFYTEDKTRLRRVMCAAGSERYGCGSTFKGYRWWPSREAAHPLKCMLQAPVLAPTPCPGRRCPAPIDRPFPPWSIRPLHPQPQVDVRSVPAAETKEELLP